MKRNTLIHHKKNQRNNFIQTNNHSQLRDSILENPQNSAKFCLLQISQEAQRSSNRTFTAFQSHHSRSFSTELFTQKKVIIQKQKVENEEKNCVKPGRYRKQESHQSVTLKSTFSNEMRKTNHLHLFKKSEKNFNQQKSQRSHEGNSVEKSLINFRKINYLPLSGSESRQMEKIDEIFHNTPSRQILAILKRTNLAREHQQNDKELNQKQKSQDKFPTRKRSIFNIRHLMMKEKNAIDSARKEKDSPQLKNQSPEFYKSKEQHLNNYDVIKLRLKKRRNLSALENN